MRLSKASLIASIVKFITAKSIELKQAKDESVEFEKAIKKLEEDRMKLCTALMSKYKDKVKCLIDLPWRETEKVDITLSARVPADEVPKAMRETPADPQEKITELERVIDRAKERLAALDMCPDAVLSITSRMDLDTLMPYITYKSTK